MDQCQLEDSCLIIILELGETNIQNLLKESDEKFRNVLFNKLLIDVIDGINFIHSKNFAHLDLKISNLILGKDTNFKLIDFGFCEYLKKNQYIKHLKGTYIYISEEAAGQKILDYKTDIFYIGYIIFDYYSNIV